MPTPFDSPAGPDPPSLAESGARRPRRLGIASELTAPVGRRRVYFEGVEMRLSRSRGAMCRVSLRKGGEIFSSTASGTTSERARAELAARATLAAISQAEGLTPSLAIETVLVVSALERRYVLAIVNARRDREAVSLTGACEIRDEVETAAALAALDATNRWLELSPGA